MSTVDHIDVMERCETCGRLTAACICGSTPHVTPPEETVPEEE